MPVCRANWDCEVTYALDQYEEAGGRVQRLILPNTGHTPYLEQPQRFCSTLQEHLMNR